MTTKHAPGNGDIIDLEPTVAHLPDQTFQQTARHHVDLVKGVGASLTTETQSLRRKRIGQAALVLTILYAVLSLWYLFSHGAENDWQAVPRFAVRFLLTATVAAIVPSRLTLAPGLLKF